MTCIAYLSSCTTQELATQPSQNQYIEIYQNTYDGLQKALTSTRQPTFTQPEITAEEISLINNLETLVSYDPQRLELIEASAIYMEMESAGKQHIINKSSEFIRAHSVAEFKYLEGFIYRYIIAGTHNRPYLESEIQSRQDEILKPYIALCAAVVDAYGEEHIWQETLEIASLTPCAKAALIKVSLVLAIVALDLAVDSTIPWAAFLTMASTINNICQLITIRNEWVLCEKNSKKT